MYQSQGCSSLQKGYTVCTKEEIYQFQVCITFTPHRNKTGNQNWKQSWWLSMRRWSIKILWKGIHKNYIRGELFILLLVPECFNQVEFGKLMERTGCAKQNRKQSKGKHWEVTDRADILFELTSNGDKIYKSNGTNNQQGPRKLKKEGH